MLNEKGMFRKFRNNKKIARKFFAGSELTAR
jgi:hypothetical protein